MSHAHKQMMDRYGFVVSPRILLQVIKAGNARELVQRGEGPDARMFDVPLTFEDGSQVLVRCVVSLNLDYVITVLPPERRVQQLYRKESEKNRRFHKEMRRASADEDDESLQQYA
jgi:hypothetical protein